MSDEVILWRRLDQPGHESCRVFERDSLWHLVGTSVFAHASRPCRLDYAVSCSPRWETVSGRVSGWVADAVVEIEIAVDASRRWFLNGAEVPAVAGCTDLDLNFSPSTNLLPIRRLGLAVGAEAPVRAAWLRFPSFALEPLEQSYRRLDATLYRYQSAGGRFTADLPVNSAGLVTRYPGFFDTEGGG